MGLRARILEIVQAVRNGLTVLDVRSDPGGGAAVTGVHFSAPGDDARALPGDYVELSRLERSNGAYQVLGYIDGANAPQAAAGEKRIYSRNAAGAVQASVWLKADGSILIANAAGTRIEVKTDNEVTINSAQITLLGDVKTASGVSLGFHTHQVSGAVTLPPVTPTP